MAYLSFLGTSVSAKYTLLGVKYHHENSLKISEQMPKSGFFLSQLHIVQDLGFSSKIRGVLTRSLKMTTTQVVEMSVTVNNNSPIQDYIHPDDHT